MRYSERNPNIQDWPVGGKANFWYRLGYDAHYWLREPRAQTYDDWWKPCKGTHYCCYIGEGHSDSLVMSKFFSGNSQ